MFVRVFFLLLLFLFTLSCNQYRTKHSLSRAQKYFDDCSYDKAMVEYSHLLQVNGKNLRARSGLRRSMFLASEQHLLKANEARIKYSYPEEIKEIRLALLLDSTNIRAVNWFRIIKSDIESSNIKNISIRKNAQYEAVNSAATPDVLNNLQLSDINNFADSVDLNFTHKVDIKDILHQLSKCFGINIILHSSVPSNVISIDLRGLSFQRIIDILMIQNDLFYKVIDSHSIIIFKKTISLYREYSDKFIQTFYLSNTDAKNIRLALSALMPEIRTLVIDERLNAIILLGTSDDIKIAKYIIDRLDKVKAEVVIYLELIETSEECFAKKGILPLNGFESNGYTVNMLNGQDRLTNMFTFVKPMMEHTMLGNSIADIMKNFINETNIKHLLNDNFGHLKINSLPSLQLDFAKSNGEARLLANPNIRVTSNEIGQITIGDKISVSRKTSVEPKESNIWTNRIDTNYEYENIGVDIKVKPIVHGNNEVTIELDANVKSLKPSSHSDRPDISERKIITKARLRDGEQIIFAGFLKEEEISDIKGLLGVSDIPVFGEIGKHKNKDKHKTDVVLSIKVNLVRKTDLQDLDYKLLDINDMFNNNIMRLKTKNMIVNDNS